MDAERDHLFRDLEDTKDLSEVYQLPDFHKKVCFPRVREFCIRSSPREALLDRRPS